MVNNEKNEKQRNESIRDTSATTITTAQTGMVLLILGASAGMTLYARKTSSMLATFKGVKRNQNMRLLSRMKHGPQTKEEFEKARPRFSEDDL